MKYIIALFVLLVLLPHKHELNLSAHKIPKKNRIEFAAQQELLMTQDPQSQLIPKDRLLSAYKDIQSGELVRSSNDINWTERGPNNVGGRVRAALFDKNDPTGKTVFAAGVSGGLWKTTNIESSDPNWQNINDFFGSLSIAAIAQHPSTPDIMYFGTGEGFFELNASPGLGIWKTTNGGSTWTHLPSSSMFQYVQNILILPNGIIIISTKKGIFRSTNNGLSWSKVLGKNNAAITDDANDLEIAADGTIYATLGIFSKDGIYKSNDDGITWSLLSNGLPTSNYHRIEIATAPSNPNVIYAAFENAQDHSCLGIYKSTNKGNSWIQVSNPAALGMNNFARTQAWYNLEIAVDPSNANIVYIGGIDILKSTDSGASWNQLTQWGGLMGKQYMHADQHLILFSPSNSNNLLIGNDGGIFYSTDANTNMPTFYAKNKGLNITQFYACVAHPQAGVDYFLAGAQDNGTQKFTNAGVNTTQEASGGDGAYCFIDKDNPNIQITSYVFNNYFVSTDGGASFTYKPLNDEGFFANPAYYDSKSNKLYASNIKGTYLRWENPVAFTPQTTSVTVNGMGGQRVSYIKASTSVDNRLYLGTSSGDVFMVDAAHIGSSKSAIKIRDAAQGFVSCIAIDKNDESHIMLSYSNYGITSIYETHNSGTTWNSVEGNLPDMPVRSAMFHPHDSDKAIIGTELGIFMTDNLNNQSTQWNTANNGLANVRVDMIHHRESDDLLTLATHGRGLFTSSSLGQARGGFETDQMVTMEDAILGNYGNCYEDYKLINIPVTLSSLPQGGATIQVSVNAAFTTATSTRDFVLNSSNLTFTSSNTLSKNIELKIIDDAIYENTETIKLSLSSADVDLSGQDELTLTINDNDMDPMPGMGSSYITIGSAASEVRDYPFGGYYEDMRVQMIFKASELAMMGLSAGPINSLSFDVASKTSSIPFSGFTIKMKTTSLSSTSLTNSPFESNGTIVYQSDLSTTIGWNNLGFSTPFIWNGLDNIIVECCYNNNQWSDDDKVNASATSFTSVQYRQADSNVGCNLSSIQKTSNLRPNIRFHQSENTDISGVLCNKNSYIAGNETAHFYHNGAIVASVRNLSNSPLACVDMSIDRAHTGNGTLTTSWLSNHEVSAKTFYVDTPVNAPYEITLYYTASELAGWNDVNNLGIIKTEVPIKSYSNQGFVVADAGAMSIIDMGGGAKAFRAQFNSFSGFGLVDLSQIGNNATLPVELTDIYALSQDGYNEVIWEVAHESHLAYYQIEKSFDARVFEEVEEIPAAQNKEYHWRDYELTFNNQTYYYRLKIVNLDGSFEYTDIVSAHVEDVSSYELVAYPNPFRNSITIAKSGDFNITTLRLSSITGKVIREFNQIFSNEIQTMDIDLADILPGIYILQYNTASGHEGQIKIVKE